MWRLEVYFKDKKMDQAGFTPDGDPSYARKEQEADKFARRMMEIKEDGVMST